MKKNQWISRKTPTAQWVADLAALRRDPGALLSWMGRVIAVAEAEQVYTLEASPHIGYQRERHGELVPFLEASFSGTGSIHLFDFRIPPVQWTDWKVRATGKIACYDESGSVVERDCDNLGALLVQMRPDAGPEGDVFAKSLGPLEIFGEHLDFASGAEARRRELQVQFEIHSDIWFPWIEGHLSEEWPRWIDVDNRELASRHTPRLNRFLAAAAEVTRAAGGSWTLNEQGSDGHLGPMLGQEGLVLDWQPPSGTAS